MIQSQSQTREMRDALPAQVRSRESYMQRYIRTEDLRLGLQKTACLGAFRLCPYPHIKYLRRALKIYPCSFPLYHRITAGRSICHESLSTIRSYHIDLIRSAHMKYKCACKA